MSSYDLLARHARIVLNSFHSNCILSKFNLIAPLLHYIQKNVQFEQRLKDNFMQSCFSDMDNSNKCFLYRSLCREFCMAGYLYKIHIPANRKAMTKLRLSSHKLMIERGR